MVIKKDFKVNVKKIKGKLNIKNNHGL